MIISIPNQENSLWLVNSALDFIGRSPSPYHASSNLCRLLEFSGFRRIRETEKWHLSQGDRCYVTRNETSVIAFRYGKNNIETNGMRLVGAHIDSPCLKLNPNSITDRCGYRLANVEVYGSPLLRTWFDRDLSLAGRIFYRRPNGVVESTLVDWQEPIAVIPSIAIHLQRDANTRQEINKQTHINPVLLDQQNLVDVDFRTMVMNQLHRQSIDVDKDAILGFDLRFYDVDPPRRIGFNDDEMTGSGVNTELYNAFLSSARIDNLLSCYAGVRALIEADGENFSVLVCNDHEEVGSMSESGAQGNFLQQVLERIGGLDPRVIRRSMLISADGAHGLHPNYPEKHDEQHAPVLNKGPVIKVNSNQRYATSDETESVIRALCEDLGIPVQVFVSRNDLACGTTIGPIVASEIGIKTADAGIAQFAMHSIRELAGCGDTIDFARLLHAFYNCETELFSG